MSQPNGLHQSVVDTLTSWQPTSPADDALRQAVLAFVLARPDACERACVPGHITASALVLDHTGQQAVLTLLPRLGRWVQLGGHCEPGAADIANQAAPPPVRPPPPPGGFARSGGDSLARSLIGRQRTSKVYPVPWGWMKNK